MAGAWGEATSGVKGGTSTRPVRLRVVRSDVQEILKRPRGSRPKKQQPPPSPQPPPPPPKKEKEQKGKGKGKKEMEHKQKEQKRKEEEMEQKGKKEKEQKGKKEEEMEQKGKKEKEQKGKKEKEQKGKKEMEQKGKKEKEQKGKKEEEMEQKGKKEEEMKGKKEKEQKGKKEMEQKGKKEMEQKGKKEMEQKGKKEKENKEMQPRGKKEKEEEEQFEPARYNCVFQDEHQGSHDFAPPELVWGKVRSHPWWPGQVFDAADASEIALQHRKAGAPLVAYFWDKTFSWSDGSTLLPFRANFNRLSAQSTMSGFVSAVDAALQEVGRRVEYGLSCSCFGSSIAKQEVHNSGIRQGAYGAAVDASYMRDAFCSEAFLDYISALGKRPLGGADLLDLATAKAQLRAFNQSRGSRDLPEFVMFEGITEWIPHTEGQRMHKSGEDDVPSKEKKSRRAGSSSLKKEALPVAMDEGSSGGATDDVSSNKGKKSKPMNSSAKKKIDIPKHSGGLNTVDVVESRTPTSKTVDDILSLSKSGRTLRSMRKKEDALEGLKMLGKVDSDEILTGKSKDAPLPEESKLICRASSARKKSKITEVGHGLGDRSANDSASPGKRRSGRAENAMSNGVPISEHGRKKKKLSELMAEIGRPDSAPDGKSKTRGKRSSHENAEDPDRDSKDTVKTRKRKKLNTLADLSSQSEPFHPKNKKSTKVGELMTKASGSSISHKPPAAKASGAASQIKSHKAKHRQINAAGKSLRPVKVNRGKKEAFSEESLSCDEMLWQLSVAACDLKKGEKIAPTSVNFFTDFRKNSSVSSSDVIQEIPEKAANTESTPPEQPIADHMQDDYWADILINVEAPLSSLKRKKDESKKRTSKNAHQAKKLSDNPSVVLDNAGGPRSEGKENTEKGEQLKTERKPIVANGSQPNAGTKSAEEMEHSVLSGLVLHFSGPRAVPSHSDLIKIFSQYGPVSEARAEIANNANSAQVIFKRRMDAEAAFAGAGKISALGPALVSFRLTDFPAIASGNEPSHGAPGRG